MKAKKNLQYVLDKLTGEGYTTKVIDGELCLYRDFGEFDVEGSGLNNTKATRIQNILYLWKVPKHGAVQIFAHVHCRTMTETVDFCKRLSDWFAEYQKSGSADSFPDLFRSIFEQAFTNDYTPVMQIHKTNNAWHVKSW